jgi:hypothetical protein
MHVGLLVRRFVSFGFSSGWCRDRAGVGCKFDAALVHASSRLHTMRECDDDD